LSAYDSVIKKKFINNPPSIYTHIHTQIEELSAQNEDLMLKLKESMERELEASARRAAMVSQNVLHIQEGMGAGAGAGYLPHIHGQGQEEGYAQAQAQARGQKKGRRKK
jgi:hypothetical protein